MTTTEDAFARVAAGDVEGLGRLVAVEPALRLATNDAGVTLLLWAQYHRQTAIVDALRSAAPELDPFEAAAVGDLAQLAAHLAATPELVSAHAGDGMTALHLAAYFRHPEAVRMLLEAGADPDVIASNESAVRPLHSAAAGRDLEVARLLLAAGASPDAAQHGGYTALMSAAMHGDEELAQLLLSHGAEAGVEAGDGRDAATMAEAGGHPELAARLRGASGS